MNLAEKQLRAWAYSLADTTMSRVQYGLLDADLRARAVKTVLDDLRPGLGEQVRQRTIVYVRGGHTYKSALREAMAEAFMRIGAAKLNSHGERLGEIDDLLNQAAETGSVIPGDPKTASAATPSSSSANSILGGVTSAVGGLLTGAMNIYSAVEGNRQARRELSAEQSRWQSEVALQTLREGREYDLRELELAEESARRQALEAATAREAAAAADAAAAAARREALLPPGGGGSDIGTYLVIGGIVLVVAVGGFFIVKAMGDSEDKKKD